MKPIPNIKWERGPDMPFGMTGNVQAAFVRKIMYVGGGDSTKADNHYVVWSYNNHVRMESTANILFKIFWFGCN